MGGAFCACAPRPPSYWAKGAVMEEQAEDVLAAVVQRELERLFAPLAVRPASTVSKPVRAPVQS